MSKHYLNVNYDGTIFEWSKDASEGFVKYTNTAGKESYRKYYNKGVEGKLICINKKNNPNLHNREEIEIVLEGENDTTYNLNFVVYGQDNFLDTYTEHLVKYLPSLERGIVYNINNWFIKKGDVINNEVAERNVKGITIKVNGEKIKPALTQTYTKTDGEKVIGDIPAIEWKEKNGVSKPTAASKEIKSDYLYDVLAENSERLKWVGTNTATQASPQSTPPAPVAETPKNSVPTASPADAFEPATDVKQEDFQDLPFN